MEKPLIADCLRIVFLYLVDEIEETPKNISRNEIKRNKTNIPYIITKDLSSCTLVSKYWRKISTPILYAYPFHKFHNIKQCSSKYYPKEHDKVFKPYYKLIRTLISCIPEDILKELLISMNRFKEALNYNFSIVTVKPTFDYFSFIRGLYFTEELFDLDSWDHYKDDWLPSYFPKCVSKIPLNSLIDKEFVLLTMKEFVKFSCKKSENFLTLELYELVQELHSTVIESLTSAAAVGGLKELYGEDILQHTLYTTCSTNLESDITRFYKHLLEQKLIGLTVFGNGIINSKCQAEVISQFISSQKNLQHIILSERKLSHFNDQETVISEGYYNIILASLTDKGECLTKLEFRNIHFNQDTVSSLVSLKKIRELKLIKCNNLENGLNLWARNLNKLEILEFEALDYPTLYIPKEFLTILFQNSSQTLFKLKLNFERNYNNGDILKEIPLHLCNLTYLFIPTLHSTELPQIFKNCQNLVYFSLILTYDNLISNLQDLSRFFPKSLKHLQLRDTNIIFDDTFRCFLQECVKGGIKYLGIKGKCNLPQDHFNFAEQIGIQLLHEVEH